MSIVPNWQRPCSLIYLLSNDSTLIAIYIKTFFTAEYAELRKVKSERKIDHMLFGKSCCFFSVCSLVNDSLPFLSLLCVTLRTLRFKPLPFMAPIKEASGRREDRQWKARQDWP